jgi:hypothetical protein
MQERKGTRMIGCKICIAKYGIKGSELNSLLKTEEELVQHIESEHHIPVMRDGETEEECNRRFFRENPEAGGENCKCPDCVKEVS